jgi:hypothetical protein
MSRKPDQLEPSPSDEILRLIRGTRVAEALYVVTELGIADLLKDGPRTPEDLARKSNTDPEALYRLLRALASVGLFVHNDDGTFALTEVGATLRADLPDSLRPAVLMFLGDEFRKAWRDLGHSVRTGETAFDHAFGMSDWEYRAKHGDQGKKFNAVMARQARLVGAAIASIYPFERVGTVVDVGGGNGSLMITLLKANPNLNGVIYDLAYAAEDARVRILEEGLSLRCEVVVGDALNSVPSGGDVYILSRIIHDWNDEKSIRILTNCNRAMTMESKLLLIERVVPYKLQKSELLEQIFFIDLNMMVMNGGRERTEEEYRSLLEASGFNLDRILQTRLCPNIIEGTKIVRTPTLS